MSGKVQKWDDATRAKLVVAIRESIAATGRVDWSAIGKQLDATVNALRFAYDRCVGSGEALSVGDLQKRYREANPRPRLTPADPGPAFKSSATEQEVQTKVSKAGMELTSLGRKIRTVEDLLAYCEVDLTKWEVASIQTSKHDAMHKNDASDVVVTPLFRIWIKLQPKAGPDTKELVESIIAGAFAERRSLPVRRSLPAADEDILETLLAPELHLNKFAWDQETRHGDYDMRIAADLFRSSAGDLASKSRQHRPARRLIGILGDYFHIDGPQGHTTKGTPLDFDGRVQKMIDQGAALLFDIIEESASTAPTAVILTPGNHDEVLTWALQRILLEHFRHDPRVLINPEYTNRKYFRWGKTLLGFTHGDKPAKKQLPSLMAMERRRDWGETTYREIHTGHTHATAAIQTIDGVIVRTIPSISAPDKWHNDNGFVGAPRTMESWFYSKRGYLDAMESSSPTIERAA